MVYNDVAKSISEKNANSKVMKANLIMERYDLLKDASNELQKASAKTAFSNLSRLNPFYLLKKGEEYNQTPINIAILRDTKIKDENGNESNVWDALEAIYNTKYKQWELSLKKEFKTEENIKNWEQANGEDYFTFKSRATSAVIDIHGDFDPRSGMKIKSTQAGQIAIMFKTWLPRQFYNMFAEEEVRLTKGKSFKGRFRSFTPASLTQFLAITAGMNFGLLGIPVAGITVGLLSNKFLERNTGMNFFQELIFLNKIMARKLLGFPVNLVSKTVSGKKLIEDDYSSFYKKITSKEFKEKDYDNYIANIHHLSLMLAMFGLYLLNKGINWDDDDDESDMRRRMCNFFSNTFLQFSSQLSAYVDPTESYKMISDMGIFRLLSNISKVIEDFDDFLNGEDIIPTGIHAGESAFTNQVKKTFIPGIFKSPFSLGFEKPSEEQYLKSPYDRYFWGEEKTSKKAIQRLKAEEKLPLRTKLNQKDITEEIYEKESKKLDKKFKRTKGQSFKQKLEELKKKRKQEVEKNED
jgi:hypothetical protein